MANEVIIEEYAGVGTKFPDGTFAPTVGEFITSQILDIAELSAALNVKTTLVRLMSKGTGFWYVVGGNSASATANTAGNRWLDADREIDLRINPTTDLKIDTAADA